MQPPTPATPISPQLQAPESDTQAVQGLGADRASSPQATADAWQQPVQRQSRQRGEWQQRGKGMVPAHGCVTRPRRSAPLHGVSGVRVMLTRAGLCRDEVRGDVERENGGVGVSAAAAAAAAASTKGVYVATEAQLRAATDRLLEQPLRFTSTVVSHVSHVEHVRGGNQSLAFAQLLASIDKRSWHAAQF